MGRVPASDEVAELLDAGWSVEEIADWAGCTGRSIRYVAKAAALELPQARRRAARLAQLRDADRAQPWNRPRTYPVLYEPGWLAKRMRARRSLQDIADEVGCSAASVRKAVLVLGIEDRRRYAERTFPGLHDGDWLRHRYLEQEKSSTDIAAELGCADGSVLHALHRAGIQVRSGPRARKFPLLHDVAWLRRRAVTEGASCARLAAEIGCSRSTAHRALQRAGIDIAGRKALTYPRLRSRSWLRRAYVTDELSLAQVAAAIGCGVWSVRAALQRAGIAERPPRQLTRRTSRQRLLRAWERHGSIAATARDQGLSRPATERFLAEIGIFNPRAHGLPAAIVAEAADGANLTQIARQYGTSTHRVRIELLRHVLESPPPT